MSFGDHPNLAAAIRADKSGSAACRGRFSLGPHPPASKQGSRDRARIKNLYPPNAVKLRKALPEAAQECEALLTRTPKILPSRPPGQGQRVAQALSLPSRHSCRAFMFGCSSLPSTAWADRDRQECRSLAMSPRMATRQARMRAPRSVAFVRLDLEKFFTGASLQKARTEVRARA